MRRPTRTNPAYAHLAYRRSIIGHVVSLLSSDYTTAMGDEEPERVIHADGVFPEDNPVPEESIQEFIQELELQGEELRLEMLKFNFVKQDEKPKQVRQRPAKKKAARGKGKSQSQG